MRATTRLGQTARLLLFLACAPSFLAYAGPTPVSDRTFSFNDSLRDTRLEQAFSETGTGSVFVFESIDGEQRSARIFDLGNGLRLDQGAPSDPAAVYTIFMQVRLSTTSSYRKLIDFRDGASDDGLYLLNGELLFYPVSTAENAVAVGDDTWATIALTRDAAGEVVGYLNGGRIFGFDDSGSGRADGTGQTIRFLADDNVTSGSEASAGAVACIRVFDQALDTAAVGMLECPYRIGLEDQACSFDHLSEAIAAAASGDELVLTAEDEYLGRSVIDGKALRFSGAEPGGNCASSINPGSTYLRNPEPVMGRGGVMELRNGAELDFDFGFVFDQGVAGAGGLLYAGPGTRLGLFYTTFRNGLVDGSLIDPATDPDGSSGGCLLADGAELLLGNSSFEDCDAGTGSGGGVALIGASRATVGGFSNYTANRAGNLGGGIYVGPGSSLVINGDLMTFARNSAAQGGAVAVNRGVLTMDPSEDPLLFGPFSQPPLFDTNLATSGGGAIHVGGNPSAPAVGPNRIARAVFTSNGADEFGGAILVNGADADLLDITAIDNEGGNSGGALYLQDGAFTISQSPSCRPYITASVSDHCSKFVSNRSVVGAAITVFTTGEPTSLSLDGAVVADNGEGPNTSAIAVGGASFTATNLWLSGSADIGISLLLPGSEAALTYATIEGNGRGLSVSTGASATIDASIIHGNTTGIDGDTAMVAASIGCNVDQTGLVGPAVDPLFMTTSLGPAHLPAGSPAVDSCADPIPGDAPVDLDGLPRVQGDAADAGAFEHRVVLFLDGYETG